MRDGLGREINYMRLSITDRCNLRCRYCMPPEGVPPLPHDQVLRYEELLEVAAAAVTLGITRFKVTGGEPLVRRGCAGFIRALKGLPGVERVSLTTNGLLLAQQLDELAGAGVDGVNVSLDTLDPEQYRFLTRGGCDVSQVLGAVAACAPRIPTKINAVALEETADQLIPLARLAEGLPVDVRFIEAMPIGPGTGAHRQGGSVLERLRGEWPDLAPTGEVRGCGPAVYYGSAALKGRICLIQAVSHSFCSSCNRVRLTSTGSLKPCLCYETGVELRPLLRAGCSREELAGAMARAILNKPAAHCFETGAAPEHRNMSQIGG